MQRFGLRTSHDDDVPDIVDSFLNILAMHDLDFHASFRVLSSFRPSMVEDDAAMDSFLGQLAECIPKKPTDSKRDDVKRAFKPWLETYAARIRQERDSWEGEDWEVNRCAEMRKVNPRFVLRQWVLEETIKKLEEGEGLERRRVLGHILKVGSSSLCYCIADFCRWRRIRSSRTAGSWIARSRLTRRRGRRRGYVDLEPERCLGSSAVVVRS